MYQTIYKRADGLCCVAMKSKDWTRSFSLALDKQIEQFEDLFLANNNDKTNFILHPIANAVQVKFNHRVLQRIHKRF